MRLSRATIASIIIAIALTGCIENMGDLKEALGVTAPPAPPPTYAAPVAKAQAAPLVALVGAPIAFASEGTKDAQGLRLDLRWDLGDGASALGPTATHAYAAPGEYTVKLVATNVAGLADEDTITVLITLTDRAPAAAIVVKDASGVATSRGLAGAALAFEASASDPDGSALTYDWDFGDGSVSRSASPTHAYETPGRYDVRLAVADRAGNVAVASTRVAIDGRWSASGAFEPTASSVDAIAFPVAAEAESLTLTLTFDGNVGLNDLEIVLLGPDGAEVARSDGAISPGAAAAGERAMELGDGHLAPGTWTARVVKESGLGVAWSLAIVEKV